MLAPGEDAVFLQRAMSGDRGVARGMRPSESGDGAYARLDSWPMGNIFCKTPYGGQRASKFVDDHSDLLPENGSS